MIVKTGILPNNLLGITLFPFILINKKLNISDRTIRHEKIHLRQQLELLIIPFYLWYGVEYLIRFFQYKDGYTAYKNVSFEKEAFDNDDAIDYLKNRKLFSFFKYIKNISNSKTNI